MTEDYGYRGFIIRALEGAKVEFDEQMVSDLVLRFTIIHNMIRHMNNFNPAKGLRSTQVMAKIIFDYLREKQND
jgi:hypothetical protein